jgi:hypothetical protein
MLYTDIVVKFLLSICYTAYLVNERPVTCFLVGKPASGKSALIKKLSGQMINNMDDVSVTNIRSLYKEEFQKWYHVKIHDFTKILQHRNAVRNEVLAEIALVCEDGIISGGFRGSEYNRISGRLWLGFVLGITYKALERLLQTNAHTGFPSRPLYFYIGYTDEHFKKIMALSKSDDGAIPIDKDLIHVNHIITKVDVTMSDNIFNQVMVIAIELGDINSKYVITRFNDDGKAIKYSIDDNFLLRTKDQLRKLAKGVALMYGRREVIQSDVDLLKSFMPYMGLRQEKEYALL